MHDDLMSINAYEQIVEFPLIPLLIKEAIIPVYTTTVLSTSEVSINSTSYKRSDVQDVFPQLCLAF